MVSQYIQVALTALSISMIVTPLLVVLSHKKGFFATIHHRSSHSDFVPNTGGIALGLAVIFPLLFFSDYPKQEDFSLLVSAFAVLLITGIIDDFNPIPVVFKFLGQFVPAIVIATSINESELAIPFLNNLIRLPHVFDYLFWIIFIVYVINAFNLIDGIDGLAIGLGIIGSVFFFIQFSALNQVDLMVFSISMTFGLVGVLVFNLSKKFKIFLGDTGSLLIGGMLVFFAVKLLSLSDERNSHDFSFFLIIGSLFIPLSDLIRVSVNRLLKGQSPFEGDRLHIHHLILALLGGNHFMTTVFLLLAQLAILLVFRQMKGLPDALYFFIIIAAFLIYFALTSMLQRSLKNRGIRL